MVRIQLSTGYLDVKEGTSFPLNFSVGDIRDISKRTGSFSKTITLIGNNNNNTLLNHYYDVNIQAGTFNINTLTSCDVIQDGIPVMTNATLQLTNIRKSQLTSAYEQMVEYEVLIKEDRGTFFTDISNKYLTDLDFSDLDHYVDATEVINSFDNTLANGFKYVMPFNIDTQYQNNNFIENDTIQKTKQENINTYLVLLGTAAKPARTDSDRVCPPTTTVTELPKSP